MSSEQIDTALFFQDMGFSEGRVAEQQAYQGPDGYFYLLFEAENCVIIRTISEANPLPNNRIILYKIMETNEICQALRKALHHFTSLSDSQKEEYDLYSAMKTYVRSIWANRMLGEREIYNLCQIYHLAVKESKRAASLADCCRDYLLILGMKRPKEIPPRLHELLSHVPDTYYDFVFGMEHDHRILKGQENDQELIRFIESHPDFNTSELIIYLSMKESRPETKNREIERAVDYYRRDNLFDDLMLSRKNNEIIQNQNNHNWQIVTRIIDGIGYTFRFSRCICFVDYMNVCIGGGILTQVKYDTVMIRCQEISDQDIHKGLNEFFIQEMIRIARLVSMRYIVVPYREEIAEYYQSIGFIHGIMPGIRGHLLIKNLNR